MKRLKKVLAVMLMAVMVLSSMTAFAAESTIDTSKDVSLTIYTYSYDGTEGSTGTGAATDEAKVPEGAQPLEGVTFTVYKIADIAQENGQLVYKVVSEISGNGETTVTSNLSSEDIKKNFSDEVLNKLSAEKVASAKSNANGMAKFSSSDLKAGQGLYIVKATEAPENVSAVVEPFVVSLPMTNVEGTDWLYDVYVYPKNGTALSTITLKKFGKTGNGSAVGVTGAKFVLQKKNGSVWENYTKNENGEAVGTDGVISMSGTSLTVSGLGTGEYRFIETSAPDTNYIMDGVAVREFSVSTDGKITIGGEEKATISVINYKPEVEKEVLIKNGDASKDSDWQEAADYSVGDRVPFKVKSTVPENIGDLKHYVLTDEMSTGLSMDSTDQKSFVVSYYNSANSKITNAGIKAVPVYSASTNSWVLDLSGDVAALESSNITSIEVTFTATLNQNAVTAGAGNPNTVSLEYTNKLYPNPQGSNPDPQNPNTPKDDSAPYEETNTIQDKVNVYTFGIELVKTFEGGTPSETVKASFDLYRTLVAGETKDTTIKVGTNTIDVKKVGSYTTDANGKITINTTKSGDADKAFSNETYYFVETATASGYNLLKEPVAAKIQVYYAQTFKTITTSKKYDKNGDVISSSQTASGTDKTTYYKNAEKTTELATTVTTVNVANRKGFLLPTTGGAGTMVFTITGLILMAAAVIVFFGVKKRQHA